jgi:hypothetical protein
MVETVYTQGFRAGQANEQERIIKVLAEAVCYSTDENDPTHEECYCWIEMPLYKVIALVEGKQNGH